MAIGRLRQQPQPRFPKRSGARRPAQAVRAVAEVAIEHGSGVHRLGAVARLGDGRHPRGGPCGVAGQGFGLRAVRRDQPIAREQRIGAGEPSVGLFPAALRQRVPPHLQGGLGKGARCARPLVAHPVKNRGVGVREAPQRHREHGAAVVHGRPVAQPCGAAILPGGFGHVAAIKGDIADKAGDARLLQPVRRHGRPLDQRDIALDGRQSMGRKGERGVGDERSRALGRFGQGLVEQTARFGQHGIAAGQPGLRHQSLRQYLLWPPFAGQTAHLFATQGDATVGVGQRMGKAGGAETGRRHMLRRGPFDRRRATRIQQGPDRDDHQHDRERQEIAQATGLPRAGRAPRPPNRPGRGGRPDRQGRAHQLGRAHGVRFRAPRSSANALVRLVKLRVISGTNTPCTSSDGLRAL